MEEVMKDTKEDKKQEHEAEDKIDFQKLGNVCLMIIVVLIIGNAILIYYMMNLSEYGKDVKNEVVNETERETLANLIDSVVSNANVTNNPTINATDANTRKISNENLIVLYNGLILDTSQMGEVELKYIDNASNDKDKYVITYYNYENFAFRDYTLGLLSNSNYENLVKIGNVGKVAISEKYEAITGMIDTKSYLPVIVSENNPKLQEEYDTIKTITTDLDKNGTDEYIIILANKATGYSKISLYDSMGKLMDNLAYIEKSKWNQTTNAEYYLSLENLNILDVDNDGVMEILLEIPKYEGEPSISLIKYKNGELSGKTNIECSLLP